MLIYLTGVLEDGSPRSPGVPTNPRLTLRLTKGGDVTLRLTILRPDGSAMTPPVGDGGNVTFTVKKKSTDSQALVAKVGAIVVSGSCDFTITPTDTKNLEPGLYAWDVWMVRDVAPDLTNRDAVIPTSPLLLEPTIMSVP